MSAAWYVRETDPHFTVATMHVFRLALAAAALWWLVGARNWALFLLLAAVTTLVHFGGRSCLTAAAVAGENLLFRRLFSARLHALPLSRLRLARARRGSALLAVPDTIQCCGNPLLPLTLACSPSAPVLEREAWERPMEDLRQALGERWRE